MIEFLIAGGSAVTSMGVGEIGPWLWQPIATKAANPQTGFSYMLFPFVCVVAIGTSWAMLRSQAMSARDFSEKHISTLAAATDQPTETIAEALGRMNFWPVGWVKLNELITIMLVLLFSLVSYRLLFIPIAFIAFMASSRMFEIFSCGLDSRAKKAPKRRA